MAAGWTTEYPFAFITGSSRYDIPFSIKLDTEPLTADKREFYRVSYNPPIWGDTEYYNYTVNKISGAADLYYAVVYNVIDDSSSGSSFSVSVILCSSAAFVASVNNGVKYVNNAYRDTENRVTGNGTYTYDGNTVYYYIYNTTLSASKNESVTTTFNWHNSTKLSNNDWRVYYNTAEKYFAWLIAYGDNAHTNNPYNRPPEDEFPRGGTGTWDNHSDVVDIDPLPAGAWGQGFVSVYNPTNAQLQNFATQLWREDLRNEWKDIFPNGGVTSGIVNCITIPIQPDVTSSAQIHVGGVGIPNTEAAVLLNRFKIVDFGVAPIKYTKEYFSGFQDYLCTKIGIYLPYIGWEQLVPEMVINCQLGLKYKIDCFTGDFIAILTTYREDKFSYRGISYTFNGNCATQVLVTSQSGGSSASIISSAISGLSALGGNLVAGNMAGAVISGAASMNSIVAENSKHSFALKGGLNGSKGQLAYQRPYLMITRPIMEDGVGNNYFDLCGIPSNDYSKIGHCSGFTKAFAVKINSNDFNNATDEEINAIVDLLKEGIFCKLG